MRPPLCFCIVSFEGPDPYARAGGLVVQVTHLADTLAQRGHETHLFFVGAPDAPPQSTDHDGLLRWHRWGQWISAHHPSGVYAGEDEKRRDLNASLPPFLVDAVIRPALGAGKLPVILAEEWHTAEALIHIHDQLEAAGLAHRCVLFWNANNTMSFDQVPWARLDAVAQITAVSHYMKHLMWSWGVNALDDHLPIRAPSKGRPPEQVQGTRTTRFL